MIENMNPNKPVQLPKSTTNSNPLSSETLNLLKKLRKQGKQNEDAISRHSPIPNLFSQAEDSQTSRISSEGAGPI